MQKTFDIQQVHEKINFLLKNFPGLSQQITSNRDKVIQMFKPVTFIQNQIIIHEGTIPPFACIIVSGSCALVSKKIPAQFSIKMEDPKKGEFFQA